MEKKTFNTQFKAGSDLKKGEFVAYPSTFTRTPDDYGDVVAKGAFSDTIADWKKSGKTMPVMYMHRMDDPDYNIGGVEDMGEDDHGWWIKAQLDMDNPIAQQVYKLVKAGRLSQLSFAFDVLDSKDIALKDGTPARELRKVKVYEASIVPVGANQDTGFVSMKSEQMPTPKDVEKIFSKAGATLSQSTQAFITSLQSQLDNMSTQIKAFLAQNKSGDKKPTKSSSEKPDQDKTEEPTKAKAEDPDAEALALAMDITIATDGGKE